MLGAPTMEALTADENVVVQRALPGCASSGTEYERCIIRKKMFHSKSYTRPERSNTTVISSESAYFVIQKIVKVNVQNTTKCIFLCTKIALTKSDTVFPGHIHECFLPASPTLKVVFPENVKCISVFLDIPLVNAMYVCDLANAIEVD